MIESSDDSLLFTSSSANKAEICPILRAKNLWKEEARMDSQKNTNR